MKNISRELVVGLVAIVTVLLFIWMFSFLKGNNLFRNNDKYYAVFNDIGGLDESSPVEINGYKAGIVREIKYINDGSGRLVVVLGINKGYNLPLGTIAEIKPETILAGMKISLAMGNGSSYHNNGDTLLARLNTGIMNELESELKPIARKTDDLISDIDTLLAGLKPLLDTEMQENFRNSSANIEKMSGLMNTLIEESSDNLASLLNNLNEFSQMLNDNSASMDTTLKNISVLTSELSEAEIKESVDNFNETMKQTKMLLVKLNGEEGSAGLFINDDSLYRNLSLSLEQLNLLLEDLKNNPGRYVSFSIFGGKKNNK